jgi:hypothetical protein
VQSAAPGNRFARAKGALRLVVPDASALASGEAVLADLEGRVLRTIVLSRGTGDCAIPLPGKGYYTITASATYDDGLKLTKTTSAAVVGKPIDREARLKSKFGIQGDGQAFVDLGAAWSWTGMMTHHVLKSGSGYAWAPTYADRIKNGKLNVSPEVNNLILLNWLPEFMQSVPPAQRGNCPTSPPKDEAEFVRYLQWLVSFIPDFVHYFGPIAEPSWSFKGSAEELARYHELIAKTVREARPDIRIVGPMMSPGNSTALESIRELDKLGMFAHLDGISINPYVVDWPQPFRSRMPEADFMTFVDAVISHFATTGRPEYPVYVTEFGWYSPNHVDELTKARYSARAALLFATRPTVKMANFFALSGGGGFSYLNSDGTPRPVYPAMAHTLRWLADCSAGASIRLSPTLHLAGFRKGRGAGIAVWDTQGDSGVTLPARSGKRVADMLGRTVEVKGGRLTAGLSPLFIELSDAALPSCLAAAAPPVAIVLAPGQSAEVGPFKEVISPDALLCKGGTLTAAATAAPGEYRLLGRAKGAWRMIVVNVGNPLPAEPNPGR